MQKQLLKRQFLPEAVTVRTADIYGKDDIEEMKTKKILSLLVAMTMLLSCVGITAMAEETAPIVVTFTDGYTMNFDSLSQAMQAGYSGGDIEKITVNEDITEKITYLEGNIVSGNPDGVTITNTITEADGYYIYCDSTNFTIGEGVTFNAPTGGLFVYGNDCVINGRVTVATYYQRYRGTKLTINEPGNLTVTGDGTMLRYMDSDPNAGIYINGDNNDETIGLNAAVIYFYQGMINAKDASIKVGTYWQTNETDNVGSANLVLDNTKMSVTVNEHNFKATGNSTVTLTNNSKLTIAGGHQFGENAVVAADATSSIADKNGNIEVASPVTYVAKIGDKYYTSFESAVADIKQDGSNTIIEILTDIETSETIEFKYDTGDVRFTAGHPVTVKQTSLETAWKMVDPKNTKFVIDENVTFEIYDNASGMYLYYGPSIEIKGSVIGGQNWGTLYLFNGDHKVTETGKIGVGRIQTARNTLEVKGEIDTNYLLVENATFVSDGAKIDAGVIYDNNNGRQRWGASEFVIKNSSEVTTNKLTLSYADSKLAIDASSSLAATEIVGAGKIIIDATGMTAGVVSTISGNASGFTGTIEVINNDSLEASIDENGNIVLTQALVPPNAVVSKLEPLTLKAGEYSIYNGSLNTGNEDLPLEIVMNFKANDTLEDCLAGGYSNWLVDFNLKFTGLTDGKITADNCYLAGKYGDAGAYDYLGWIVIPTDGMELKADETYPVVSTYDATLNYTDICNSVKDFTAAIHVDQAILDANPNFEVELSLVMTNPDDANDKLVIGEPAVYTAEDLKNETVVAAIGEKKYSSLEKAIADAKDGDTINLIWEEGDAPIAMNGSVFGKSVTITGDATVDWSKGFLFVGRGGEGNGTVTFDNANLKSASNSSSYGIHVSGREKDTNNKYDGTLTIKDSAIELDYLINRGVINVDNSTLTVKNGFGIAGRPASETESGEAATATINIANGSYVKVLNHNGMGVGVASATSEGNGVLNLTDSTFECASFNIDAKLGDFNVYGESTLNIGTLTGKEIDLHHNAVIKDSCVGGEVMLYGKVTFRGDNTFSMLSDYGNAYSTEYAEWIVEKGASVTLTEKARYGLGYGDKVTIYGNLEDALTARETLTEDDISLFTHGLVAMSNWNVANSLTVKDAYVVIGSNNSFGNSPDDAHVGTYDIDFENAVLDASRITFYAAKSKTDFSFKNSDVKVGTFMTRDTDSVFTLNNTKLVSTTTTNGTDEGNYHAGTLNLENSSITYSAPLVMENGTLTLGENSSLTAPTITGTGKIVIDATGMTAGEATNISGNASGFTGTIEVINNDSLEASIDENGNIVLTQAPEVEKFKLHSMNIDLEGALVANFYVDPANLVGEDYYAKIVHSSQNGDIEEIIKFAQWTDNNGFKCFSYSGLVAKNMADKITVTIFNKNDVAVSEPAETSLSKYALNYITANAGENMTAYQSAWVKAYVDMLNYGAEAQKHFSYNASNLANANLGDYKKYATKEDVTLESNAVVSGPVAYANVDLEDRIVYNAYFTGVTGDMHAEVSFTNHLNKLVTETIPYEGFVMNNGFYQLSVKSLVVADANQQITIVVKDSTGKVHASVTDSINGYLARAIPSQEKFAALGKAMAKFTTSVREALHINDLKGGLIR